MLELGDIFLVQGGDVVRATVPRHFLHAGCSGNFDLEWAEVLIEGKFLYLEGEYVVTSCGPNTTGMEWLGEHRVLAENLRNRSMKVDFFQTGGSTALIRSRPPTGKAVLRWVKDYPPLDLQPPA